MTLEDEDLGNLLPLVASGVHARRVVGARMQKEDGLRRRRAKETKEGVEAESDRLGVVVGVVDGGASRGGDDGLVVG